MHHQKFIRPVEFILFSTTLFSLTLIACQSPLEVKITQLDQPLQQLNDPVQTAEFELRASHTGELIATGLSLRPIAQASSPIVDETTVQATDVIFSGNTLLASYNFKGEPHRGALQIIDVTTPNTPILRYQLTLPRVDLNRIRMYQDRYLVVAAGDASDAATMEIFDIEREPRLVASLDLPSRQATMVAIFQNYALVTTGDDGGVICVSLADPSAPEIVSYYTMNDARYVEVLSEREVLLVSGGNNAALTRLSWSDLTDGQVNFDGDNSSLTTPQEEQRLDLAGLTVGAPSWGFKVGERFHLSADEQGLLTFSLADGGIVETGSVPTKGNANAGAVNADERFALLANGQEGLLMLDVQGGHPTQVLARFDTPGDHGSANAVAIKGCLVALADGLGGVKLLKARLLRRGGRIATMLLNFVDAGISRDLVENLIEDAFTYTTPTLSPNVLYVLDDFNNGEHPEDPVLTQSILEEFSQTFTVLDEPLDGLTPADVEGYDLIWFANPGWYVEDAASVDTLISFSAQGGGIILQGDDMTHRRTGDSMLSELTGLSFVNNGTRTCGERTDNQNGLQYEVTFDSNYHPLVRNSLGTSFLYGDDIDHSTPLGLGEEVLAWATLNNRPNCNVRVPVIVAWDPSQPTDHFHAVLSTKTQSRLGQSSPIFQDGDVIRYHKSVDQASLLLGESIFRQANGELGAHKEIDAIHYSTESKRYLLSTQTKAYVGENIVEVRPGDIVEYDPRTDQAQIVLSQDLFLNANGGSASAVNIDAIYRDEQGVFYLSTKNNERLGAAPNTITFGKGDIVRYDPLENQATIVLSADQLFRRNNGEQGGIGDIDALHMLDGNRILFSSFSAEFVGENHFEIKDGDLVIYDQSIDQASLYMSESVFRKANGDQGAQADVDSISLMPAP
jgi:hypothetical protein